MPRRHVLNPRGPDGSARRHVLNPRGPSGHAKMRNRIDCELVGHGVWQIGVRHSLPIWVSWLQPPKRMRLARQSATAQTACLRALVGLTLRRACAQHPFVRFAYVGFDSVRNRNADGFLVIYVSVECFFSKDLANVFMKF